MFLVQSAATDDESAQVYQPSDCDRDTQAHDHRLPRSTPVRMQAAWIDEVSVTVTELFEAPQWSRPPSRRSAKHDAQAWPCVHGPGHAHLRQKHSEWANALKITNRCLREDFVRSFNGYILKHPELLAQPPKLCEKVLVCHCDKNQACHPDVLRN